MPVDVRKQPVGAGSLLPCVFRGLKLRSLGPLLTVSYHLPPPLPMFLFKKHCPEQVESGTLSWFIPSSLG